MGVVSIEDRFRGTCNLVILHLRRAARSNDLETGFETARSMGMLKPEQESFVRQCLAINDDIVAGRSPEIEVTDNLIKRLQSCILSLNTADPA